MAYACAIIIHKHTDIIGPGLPEPETELAEIPEDGLLITVFVENRNQVMSNHFCISAFNVVSFNKMR